jgi:hypothetical protein
MACRSALAIRRIQLRPRSSHGTAGRTSTRDSKPIAARARLPAVLSLRSLFRPWLRVARPDDWTGTLARISLWPVYFVALLVVGLGRIPSSWWVIGAGSEPLTRAVIAIVVLYLLGWVRAFVLTLMPRAVIQYGRRLWFRHRGRRIVVRIANVSAIVVEQRPPPVGETFVIELDDGAVYDLCPVGWEGAERIYAAVATRVRRARARAQRRLIRAQRRAAGR